MPKRRSKRRSKEQLVAVQQDEHQTHQGDVVDEHPNNPQHTPPNQLVSSRQSPDQAHHDIKPSQTENDSLSCQVNPVSPSTNEQADIQKRQTCSEQTDPANTNQTSSQMTQEKNNSSEGQKRTGRKRRSRGRSRSQKRRHKASPTTNQTIGNGQAVDLTGSNPTVTTTYYGIKNGKYGFNGVHTDWDVCVRYLKGTCGATFKSFRTIEEAFTYVHGEGAADQPPEQRNTKREALLPSDNGKTDNFPIPETKSGSAEGAEPPKDSPSPNIGHCLDGEPPSNDQTLEDLEPSQNDVPSSEYGAVPVVETRQDDPSMKEFQPQKGFECSEEVGLQKWKVEPVLLPTALFTPEDNPVKREHTLIPVEPASGAF